MLATEQVQELRVQACGVTPFHAQYHHKKVPHNMLPIERQVQGLSVQVPGVTLSYAQYHHKKVPHNTLPTE